MVVVDIETTGLDFLVCSIIEIGAINFESPENQFEDNCRIWEGAKIDPEALKWNGHRSQLKTLNT